MAYYTERNGMREPLEKTYAIDPQRYEILLGCCRRYYKNIAWKFPEACPDGYDCCGLDEQKMVVFLSYEIPTLYIDESGCISSPNSHFNVFEGERRVDEYDQYALLDFIEFIAVNIRDVKRIGYHSFFGHHHLSHKATTQAAKTFRGDINDIFLSTGLLYELDGNHKVRRLVENDVTTPEVANAALSIRENTTRSLLREAIDLHHNHALHASRDSVEKIWDAFERLKTYHEDKNKRESVSMIVDDTAGDNEAMRALIENEFRELTKIGNEFIIRHFETNKVEITDERHYDYLFNRCLALIAMTAQYLK